MNLTLDQDQTLLAETARRFVDEHSPIGRFRALRDAKSAHDPEFWRRTVALGWQALVIPEANDGLALGMAELAIVLETLGRNLAPEPLLSTALAADAIANGGTADLRAEWLPRIAAGDAIATVAIEESGTRYDPARVATVAERGPSGGLIVTGAKVHIADAASADLLLVLVRTDGVAGETTGLTWVAIPSDSDGVTVSPEVRVDGRGAATVTFEEVRVPATSVVGEFGQGLILGDRIIDFACIGLAAEMVGAATHAMEITLAYMRERVQFDTAISSFQALQHRMAQVFVQVELARSAVLGAARAFDAEGPNASKLASMAKAKAGIALELAAKEGVQFHGGVGMTDEYDIGLFLKRARGAEVTFGDRTWHRRRWARLAGY